jgi:hypothetical protein
MTTHKPRATYPWWVRFVLFGLPTRASAMLCMWICVILTVLCALFGFVNRWFFTGMTLLPGALGYWLAIHWVDRHGHWEQDAAPQPDSSSKSG